MQKNCCDLWDHQTGRAKTLIKAQKRQLRTLDDKIAKTMDRLLETDSDALIASYEGRIKELETEGP